MSVIAWQKLSAYRRKSQTTPWLESMLKRNTNCDYLKNHGHPLTKKAFRSHVPLTSYEHLQPWMERIIAGNDSVLFNGRPVAFEKTGGSSGGSKLIPYSAEGLDDFRSALLPWLQNIVSQFQISGSAYFSLSPACRKQHYIQNIPIGLTDMAYVGEQVASVLSAVSAVDPSVSMIENHEKWKAQTLLQLEQAQDLELISVWSPTFLLQLFEGVDTQAFWPKLKMISCWSAGASAEFAEAVQRLFPHAYIQPKGLMSTEAVITTPDKQGQPVLTNYGFVEFRENDDVLLLEELELGHEYEVIVTTASGLYRYCTGDIVQYQGMNKEDLAILPFIGRQGLVSDLVGEKLTDSFVSSCVQGLTGFKLVVPNLNGDGYTLILDNHANLELLADVETKLTDNPQYAYARKLGQLKALTGLYAESAWHYYQHFLIEQGSRLGDIKPVALRSERHWNHLFRKKK